MLFLPLLTVLVIVRKLEIFLSTDNSVNTLSASTRLWSGLSSQSVVPETDCDTVINESNGLTAGEWSHVEDCESSLLDSSDVLQVVIGRSRKLKDHEKYDMITSSQNVDDTNLDTVYLLVSGGRKGNKYHFNNEGYRITSGYIMV